MKKKIDYHFQCFNYSICKSVTRHLYVMNHSIQIPAVKHHKPERTSSLFILCANVHEPLIMEDSRVYIFYKMN